MQRFNDFYEAYNFLEEHELCKCKPFIRGKVWKYKNNYFKRCLDIEVVKVNPENHMIDDDDTLNKKNQVWLEFGRAFLDLDSSENVMFEHDCNLDCGADTFEEAIIRLANLVNENYYDNGEDK